MGKDPVMTNTRRFASPFAERFDLRVPIVQGPMAGGPTPPARGAAVSNAGALGFLAASALAPEKLASEVAAIRALTGRPFGVNLFVLEPFAPDEATVRRALEAIDPLRAGLGLPAGQPLERYASPTSASNSRC